MRFLVCTLAAGLLFAQEKPAQQEGSEPREAEVIQVKTLTGDSFQRMLNMLNVFPANIKGDSQSRTILVYAPKDVLAQVRRVVEELDRPGSQAALGKNIEMTLTLLRCGGAASGGAAALPSDMESVIRQLRAVTPCKEPQVWDAFPIRLQEGRQSSDQAMLPGSTVARQVRFMADLIPEAVYRKDQSRYVRFSRVRAHIEVRGSENTDLSIDTSGDFMEGQKTVLGKISGMGQDESVFAVIALKVLD